MTELLPEFSPSAYLTDNQLSRLTRIPVYAEAEAPSPMVQYYLLDTIPTVSLT